MTVAQLMSLLEEMDPEAEVRIMSQESWPFENRIRGIAVRSDFGGECDCHRDGVGSPHEEGCSATSEEYADGTAASDVFIVEGA